MVNQGETMDKRDLMTPKRVEKYTEKQPNKYVKDKSKNTCRVTKKRIVGIQDDNVETKLAVSDEEYIVTLDSFDSEEQIITREDDGNLPRKPSHSNEDEEDTSTSIRV